MSSSPYVTTSTKKPPMMIGAAKKQNSSALFGNFSSREIVRSQQYRPSKRKKMKMKKVSILTSSKAVWIDHFLNHSLVWASIVCVLTIWALYVDDLKLLYLPKTIDPIISVINWIIFAIFMIEWGLDSLVHLEYFGSLTSVMDLLAAMSLIPMGEIMQDQTSVARIARTFRALRILRATRAAAMALKTEAAMKRAHTAKKAQKDLESGSEQKQSKSLLEATLLERGNVKMLLGVLVLLMGMSLIDYNESDRAGVASLSVIDVQIGIHSNLTETDRSLIVDQYRSSIEYNNENVFLYRRLIYLNVYNNVWVNQSNISPFEYIDVIKAKRRSMEISVITTPNCAAMIDIKPLYNIQSVNSIVSTTFSIVVIMLWVMSFRRDYHVFVLRPVQRMVKILAEMTKNPRLAIAKGKMSKGTTDDDAPKSEMEIIEACIGKFGLLLKVGFGEAGMQIIANNMSKGKVFDPVIPGVKVMAIFGFCDIRNFTDCCEVLEEETMIFTNSIASVVHSRVHSSGGVVNKNIGDAFLTVWKIKSVAPHTTSSPEQKKLNIGVRRGSMFAAVSSGESSLNQQKRIAASHQPSKQLSLQRKMSTATRNMFVDMGSSQEGSQTKDGNIETKFATNSSLHKARLANSFHDEDDPTSLEDDTNNTERYVHFLSNSYSVVDEALQAFLKIRAALTNDPGIQEVASNPKLQNKIPGYSVRMGYGLHLGWGIEGAIGSSHKVDASYLSPHVNMSARLESSSKQFGVQLLLSDAFVKQLYSSSLKADMRPLDVVTVKGSLQPITLYTYQPAEYPDDMDNDSKIRFTEQWLVAFDAYVDGKWNVCREALKVCLVELPGDGPCQTMIRTIQEKEAPEDWKGYRALTSK